MIIEAYDWQPATIISVRTVAQDTIALRVTRPLQYRFRAGQYAIMRVQTRGNEQLMRQYSFSSSPDAEWLEFTIQREPGGEVTSWLFDYASAGHTIELSQSFGHFTFESASRPLLFIAGKVGIAPFMSFVRENHARDTHILYSVSNRQQLCYWDELARMTTAIITSESARININTLSDFISHQPIIYLCGSRQFAEAIQSLLHTLNVPSQDIKREFFTL